MAFKLAELFVELTTKDAKMKTGLDRAKASLKSVGTTAWNATKIVAGMGAAAAYTGIKFVKMAAVQEEAVNRVRAAFEAQGMDADALTSKYEAFASAIQKTTTVGDEEVLSLVALATNMGVAENKIEKATRGAIGLSKAFGMDMNMSMRAVSLAMTGQTTLLTRYIPQLQGVKDDTKALQIVNDAMAKGFAQAQAETKTTSGAFQQFENRLGDAGEKIGAAIIKGGEFRNTLDLIITKIEASVEAGSPMIKFVEELASGISVLIEIGDKLANSTLFKTLETVVKYSPTMLLLRAREAGAAAATAPFLDTGAANVSVRGARSMEDVDRQLEELRRIRRNTAESAVVS